LFDFQTEKDGPFSPASEPAGSCDRLRAFVQLAGENAWWKRVNQLDRDTRRSEFQTMGHHRLETEIAAQIASSRDHGRLS
jgi:hypothetical protein